ncbi:hypothetical protein [Ruminococcus flavefaciens]|uniref:Lipoprotein n=1 Tax=Ruminococcus flavefaciens TaxID=1265 RepID=A0A1M7GNF9_RUMFL|nr:hypothetical protein [Ruminococcus flavefaciens]SHM17658.1 hypothetical protein SAMN04487860_101398 [Ruminococcus flavefaciens]
MKIRRIFSVLAAAAVICGTASCNEKVKTSKNADDTVNKSAAPSDLSGVDFEDTVTAGSGDAYLAIADKDFTMQYLGGSDENNQLTFDAGVVHIDGNGDYKVSVNADTKGFRYRATGDPDKEYKPKGLEYAAVIINDGEAAVPDAVITIKKVKVDGKDIELKKKSFTYTDAGKLRSNIFNEWIADDGLPEDSRTDKGALFNNFDNSSPSDINDGSYSAQLVDTGVFNEWTKVEVEFSISGLDK